jgi:hypothetical protein
MTQGSTFGKTAAIWSHQTLGLSDVHNFIVTDIHVNLLGPNCEMLHFHYQLPICIALVLRGGMDNPSGNFKDINIPYLSNIRFMWKGIPCVDFHEKVMMPLENGLASVSIQGYTLLETCNQTDAGGVFGNPPRAAAPQDAIEKSMNRNKVAFASLMNYTSRSCWFYKFAMREMNQSGIHVLRAIRNYGTIATPPRIKKMREDAWNNMTMEALRIPYDQDGWYLWADTVKEVGRKQQKTGQQMLDKWIDGLPSFVRELKSTLRHDQSPALLFPATWGGMFPGCPNAANAHPNAGQPSAVLFAKKYFPDWCHHSNTANKEKPFGFLSTFSLHPLEQVDIDNIVQLIEYSKITPKTVCFGCGGEGHGLSTKMPDGSIVPCPTTLIKQSGGDPSKSTNPQQSDYKKKYARQVDRIEELEKSLSDANDEINKIRDFKQRRRTLPRRTQPSASECSECSNTDESEQQADAIEEDSDDSAGSHVQDFADAVRSSSFQGKKPSPSKRR